MDNFKAILQQQKEALEKDVKDYVDEIFSREELLEDLKQKKSKCQSALRSIEKKLSKLTN